MTEKRATICDRESLATFAIYLGLSLFFFGRGLIGHFGDRYIGAGPDPAAQMFYSEWLWHAFVRGMNPFIVRTIWVPEAVNITHTGYPIITSAILAVISRIFGLIRAYNAIVLVAPALSGWGAFVLFRQICGNSRAAACGGFVYGFSPFTLGHIFGQLNFMINCLPPLAILIVLERLADEISARRFVMLFTLTLLLQFGCSTEIFATMTLVGGAAFALSWLIGGADVRRKLLQLAPLAAFSYVGTMILVSPYLYYFLKGPMFEFPLPVVVSLSCDPVNFILPTRLNEIGLWASRYLAPRANLYDATAYLGAPALLIVGLTAWRHWSSVGIRLCLWNLLLAAVLALGPVLFIRSGPVTVAPEILLYLGVPLFKDAMPCRFTIFLFLSLGALIALWFADESRRPVVRVTIGAAAVLSFLPNLNPSFWTTEVNTPAIFRSAGFKKYISPTDVVLVLPYGYRGNSDLWQAQSGLQYRMAGGFLGISPLMPKKYSDWPIVPALYGPNTIPDLADEMAGFLADKRVNKVIVPDNGPQVWHWSNLPGPREQRLLPFTSTDIEVMRDFFSSFDPAPVHVGGVTIFQIRPDRSNNKIFVLKELQIVAARRKLESLILAAQEYDEMKHSFENIDLAATLRLGLLPALWLGGGDRGSTYQNGLIMMEISPSRVKLGVQGSYSALETVKSEFASFSQASKLSGPLNFSRLAYWSFPTLQLDFDREGLAKAAAYAKRQEASAAATARKMPISTN